MNSLMRPFGPTVLLPVGKNVHLLEQWKELCLESGSLGRWDGGRWGVEGEGSLELRFLF